MRIIRSPGLRAVVRVRDRGMVAVAFPAGLPSREVLELASLVLSTSEYEELRDVVEPVAGRGLQIGGVDRPERPVG